MVSSLGKQPRHYQDSCAFQLHGRIKLLVQAYVRAQYLYSPHRHAGSYFLYWPLAPDTHAIKNPSHSSLPKGSCSFSLYPTLSYLTS